MTLTQQFILVSILPASFLALAFYSLRTRRRPGVTRRWFLTLLTAAVWSSSVLSYYGGRTMSDYTAFYWRLVGIYALSLLPLLLLITIVTALNSATDRARITIWLSAILWLAAAALDPGWMYDIPTLNLAVQDVTHFDLWAAMWVTSWLLPGVAAWFLTQRAARYAPGPLYRNQINYWLLSVTFLVLGTGIDLIRDLVWQQLAVIVAILGGLVGTFALTRGRLPNLRLAVRRLMSRLLGAALIFGLTWVALSFISQAALDSLTNLGVIFPSIIFAGAVVAIYHVISQVTNRLFLPAAVRPSIDAQEQFAAASTLLAPEPLAQLTLQVIHTSLSTVDAWIMRLEDGPGGRTMLRPLASLQPAQLQAVCFPSASPFIAHLRRQPEPLSQYDIETIDSFLDLTAAERQQLHQWQRAIYAPLLVGQRLIGLIGVGAKYSDEQYENRDMAVLQEIACNISPLLAHTMTLAGLQRASDQLFEQSQELIRSQTYLRELTILYSDFMGLLSPELRKPFGSVEQEMLHLRQELAEDQEVLACLGKVEEELELLKSMLSGLQQYAVRLQAQNDFKFELVNVDEMIRQAVHNLSAMAEARRVQVDLLVAGSLRPVYGDPRPLIEAVQQLIHNAIKFNKIGGKVTIECLMDGSELVVNVIDNGVGLPDERLAQMLAGFASMEQLRASPARGTGMGLPLARFIVQAHGGWLQATSKHGAGSTFSIHLPVVFEQMLNGEAVEQV
jgi:signal transduction histidine kinase